MISIRGTSDALFADPRLSQSQREHLHTLVNADLEAYIVGLDSKLRPVVEAMLGQPRRKTRYALLRNGNPVAVIGRIKEEWGR